MNEVVAYAIIGVLLIFGLALGVWLSKRVNPLLGLPIPDGSGPIGRKVLVAIMLIATIVGVTWLQTGLREPGDLLFPAIFVGVALVIVFRGIKSR